MPLLANAKKEFVQKRDILFFENSKQNNPLEFSMRYSILVEELIRTVAHNKKYNFALASAGSFSRRELSPYSDIDLMFIAESVEQNKDDITELVTALWDNGIEVAHTVRDYSDIQKFLNTDLHTFTQFFETRFLLGNEKIYSGWNKILFELLDEEAQAKLLQELFADMQDRYEKFGDSPKVLEPNVKLSAGGLRDFQAIEWMYILKNKTILNKQREATQAEIFVEVLKENNYTTANECLRLIESYKLLIAVRNLLHLISHQKNDRFEFAAQKRIAHIKSHEKDALADFMRKYFYAANVINRFSKSMVKKFNEEISNPLPDALAFDLDDDFVLKAKTISLFKNKELSLSDIMRALYYRGLHSAHFDENLRSLIVEKVENDTYIKSPEVNLRFFLEKF